jgi:uncharacterized protein YggT (Ycf19 family)
MDTVPSRAIRRTLAQLIPPLIGLIEALLLARLVSRLLAARPDNLAFVLLYRITDPLVAPFAALDAGQPRFGAVLELSTLALIVLLAGVGYLVWRLVSPTESGGG